MSTKSQHMKTKKNVWVFIALALGVAYGTSLGIALDNTAIGVAIGSGVAVTFTIAISLMYPKKKKCTPKDLNK